jgi:hypothetical protein
MQDDYYDTEGLASNNASGKEHIDKSVSKWHENREDSCSWHSSQNAI